MTLKLLTATLIFVLTAQYASAEEGKGFIKGRALLPSGKPMQNALVLCYQKQNGSPPLPERYWRVPDSVVPVEADGKYTVELTEGEYYLGLIGRKSAELVPGPPLEGDILILLKNKSGEPEVIKVSAGITIDTGTQKGSVYRRSALNTVKPTTVEGTVKLPDGKPVPGAFVFAFHSPERGSRPVFASDKTDRSGKYVLRVDGDGVFYLKARDIYGGGKPQPGQLHGVYGGEEAAQVTTIKGNKLKGIDIVVNQTDRPAGK